MAQAYLTSQGLILVVAGVTIAAFRDHIPDAVRCNKGISSCFPLVKCRWPPAQDKQRFGGFLSKTKAGMASLNVLIKISFPPTLGPEGSSQLMSTKLLSI